MSKFKNDDQQDKKPGADGEQGDGEPVAAAAPVQVNEDGSITIAESGLSAAAPEVTNWVGLGLKPDSRYSSLMVSKFINCLMYQGKKATAEALFYDSMEQIANKLKSDPLPVFEQALQNAKPLVEVRSKRIGGANYQVPVEVNKKRQQTIAIRWILEAVRTRKGRPTAEKLAQELIDCYNKTGTTIQKRENTHRMAEANKAFAHFA
ncbi:MAG: 30S ribosomal protein S7 [Planctomycetes bacterium]|nr:30S ribosomal protein S7 [Planctomycetota bacterium]